MYNELQIYYLKQAYMNQLTEAIGECRYKAGYHLYDKRTSKSMSEENEFELEEFYNDISVKLFEIITKSRKDIEK